MREGKKWETEQLMRFTCWKLFICQRSENPGCTSLSVLHHSSDSLQTWWLDRRGPWYHVVLRFWLKVAVLVQCVQGHKYTDQTERSFHSPKLGQMIGWVCFSSGPEMCREFIKTAVEVNTTSNCHITRRLGHDTLRDLCKIVAQKTPTHIPLCNMHPNSYNEKEITVGKKNIYQI